MNRFFYFYNSLCSFTNTPVSFSFDPYLSAIKEMLVSELQQIVYYIEKLKDMGQNMSEYRDKVIEFISVLIVNSDFKKESFFVIVEDLYNNKKNLEDLYISLCNDTEEEPKLLAKEKINLNNKESIIKALNETMKSSFKNDMAKGYEKILYEIIINIVLNACNSLIELKNSGVDYTEGKDEVLCLLNSSNESGNNFEKLKTKINDFSGCNYKIVKLLYSTIIKNFGPVIKTKVNLGTKKSKAVLVSGASFLELQKILEASLNYDVDIYTHHEMLCAHEYEKLKKNKNFKGHYQLPYGNYALEFAQFPGPIYISSNSIPKIDVIRGQIYTSARYPAYGIAKIENYDFKPMFDYALKSQGFTEDDNLDSFVEIGFNSDDLNIKISEIKSKFETKNIRHIFIIGYIDMFNVKSEYMKKFVSLCPDDCYIISFCINSGKENFWHVNSFYDFPILYNIIEKLSENISDFEKNVSIFMSECNPLTISHIFNLLYLGLKNIFLGPCCPNLINPAVIEGISKLFGVKSIDNPEKDIKIILK